MTDLMFLIYDEIALVCPLFICTCVVVNERDCKEHYHFANLSCATSHHVACQISTLNDYFHIRITNEFYDKFMTSVLYRILHNGKEIWNLFLVNKISRSNYVISCLFYKQRIKENLQPVHQMRKIEKINLFKANNISIQPVKLKHCSVIVWMK